MIIIDYDPKKHKQITHACALALKHGKAVVYPTDTSYGLAVDVTNVKALRQLYRLKGRDFKRPVHVVVPSLAYAKKVARWNGVAQKLAKKFWPGPLSLVLPLASQAAYLKMLAAGTKTIGLRWPDNHLALDLAKTLGRPIAATSANRLGQGDAYSLAQVLKNFQRQKYQPDIIINAGTLPKRQPSTLLKISSDHTEILRSGPVTETQIKNILK